MRFLTTLAMLIACLVYGFMPAGAVASGEHAPAPVAASHATTDDAHAGHHAMMGTADTTAPEQDQPCPHGTGACHNTFCAACLAIVPMPETVRDGHARFPWRKPELAREPDAVTPAPADPPPRA